MMTPAKIKKAYLSDLFKAAEKAISRLEKLPDDERTVLAAYDLSGGIGSMFDVWPNLPRRIEKRLDKLEQKFESVLHE